MIQDRAEGGDTRTAPRKRSHSVQRTGAVDGLHVSSAGGLETDFMAEKVTGLNGDGRTQGRPGTTRTPRTLLLQSPSQHEGCGETEHHLLVQKLVGST